MKSDNNVCNGCGYAQLKKPAGKRNRCPVCGYPLELSIMLERLRVNKHKITEVICCFALVKIDPKQISLEEAWDNLEKYEHLIFPEMDEEDIIAISIVNDHYFFNFGPPGSWKNNWRFRKWK